MPGLSPAPSDLGGKCEKARSYGCFYLQTKQGKQLWTPCQGVRPRSGPGAGGGGQGLSANLEAPEACIGLCLLWAPPGKAKRVALVRSDEGEAGPWGTGLPASLPLSGAQQESGGAGFCFVGFSAKCLQFGPSVGDRWLCSGVQNRGEEHGVNIKKIKGEGIGERRERLPLKGLTLPAPSQCQRIHA